MPLPTHSISGSGPDEPTARSNRRAGLATAVVALLVLVAGVLAPGVPVDPAGAGPAPAMGPDDRSLDRLYLAYFDRAPDARGLAFWQGRLDAGWTLADVSQQFARSPEFVETYGALDDAEFVRFVYRNVLGREPDGGGFDHWASQLATGRIARGGVMLAFSDSSEYKRATGIIGLPPFGPDGRSVERLYLAYFDRSADAGGLAYWYGQLDRGIDLDAVSQQFARSPEFIDAYGALDDAEFVRLIYGNVLGRDPDAGGLAHWTGRLADRSMSRGGVMLAFSDSPEFKAFTGIFGPRPVPRSPDPAALGRLTDRATGREPDVLDDEAGVILVLAVRCGPHLSRITGVHVQDAPFAAAGQGHEATAVDHDVGVGVVDDLGRLLHENGDRVGSAIEGDRATEGNGRNHGRRGATRRCPGPDDVVRPGRVDLPSFCRDRSHTVRIADDTGPDVGGAAVRVLSQYDGLPVFVVNSTFGGGPGLGNSCSNGAGLSSIGVSMTVINSRFTHNEAIGWGANPSRPGAPGGGSGGAIYNDGNRFTLRVLGTLIEDNTAREGGGAIFFVSNNRTGSLVIDGSTLRRNPSAGFETSGLPGIFYLGSGGAQVTNSSLS